MHCDIPFFHTLSYNVMPAPDVLYAVVENDKVNDPLLSLSPLVGHTRSGGLVGIREPPSTI